MSAGLFAQIAGDIMSNIMQSEHDTGMQNRQHSHDMEMFNMQKQYNNEMLDTQVTRKMGDLRRAGLSPAFLNGSQIGAQPLGVSPSSTSATGNRLNGLNLAQGLLTGAQIKNLEADKDNKVADTDNKKLEADRRKIENEYLPALKQREVLLQDGTLKLQGSQCNYTDEQCKNIAQQTVNLRTELDKANEEINKLKAETANIAPDTIKKYINAYFETDMCKAIINKYKADSHLSYEQAKDLAKTRLARLYNLYTQGEINEANTNKLWIENGQLGLDLELDTEYKETERKIDMWLKPLRLVSETITGFAPFVIARKSSSKADVNVRSNSNSTSTSTVYTHNMTPKKSGRRRR